MILNIMVGVPGSGKSYYIEQNKKANDLIICPDSIREELTGNISDQSQNNKVWEIAYKRLNDSKQDTWFDATNLSEKSLRNILQNAAQFDEANIFIMTDSNDESLCLGRIRKDISEGKNRSNVPVEIVHNMFEKMKNFSHNLYNITNKLKEEFKNVNLIKFI